MIETTTFKQVMSQLASGVTIVTVAHQGMRHGLTASSFTSLSANPPSVLVCVNSQAYSHDLIQGSGAFAVNILSAEQIELGKRFADPRVTDRFAGVSYREGENGCPLLPGSLAWLECRLQHSYSGGDHTIFVGEVMAGGVGDIGSNIGAMPLMYYNRAWRQVIEEVPVRGG